jgi:hypothetical protein
MFFDLLRDFSRVECLTPVLFCSMGAMLTFIDTRYFIVKSFNEENVLNCIQDVSSPIHLSPIHGSAKSRSLSGPLKFKMAASSKKPSKHARTSSSFSQLTKAVLSKAT